MIRNLKNFHLVPSKINPPILDHRCVFRPRLFSTLDSAISQNLIIISAPAGCGKTTVVVQWLNTIRHPSAWLTLDEFDSDLRRFLLYLNAAIHKVFPQFGSNLNALVSSPKLPPVEFLADSMIADLAALAEPVVLVLDDFQSIDSEPVQFMSRLIRYLPANLHLVIMTRVDPPFPLATWRVRGWHTDISAVDLSFSKEEAHAYFSKILDRQQPDPFVEKIVAQTEGWAAGIQIAAISLAKARDLEVTTGQTAFGDQILFEFLLEEVINKQPDNIVDFLFVTSLLETFSTPLCDYIASKEGHPQDSVKSIAHLQKENLFLVSLEGDGIWYRYHNLFQIFLAKWMKETLPPSRQTKILQYAGEWFAERGNLEQGLNYLINAGDLDAAADLVGTLMHAYIDNDNSRSFLPKWLEKFPDGAEKKHPTLLLANAYARVVHWDLVGIIQMLDEAEVLLEEAGSGVSETRRQSLLGDIEVLRAFCLYWQGDAEGAKHYARLYLLREMPFKHQYAFSLAVTYAAGSSALCGQLDDACLLLENALVEDCKLGSLNTAHLLMAKAMIYLYQAHFAEVKENAKKAVIVHQSVSQPFYWMGYVPYLLGSIAYEQNLLDEAEDHFSKIVERMRYRVNPRMYHDSLIGLTIIAREKGNEEKSTEYADRAFSFAIEVKDPLSIYFSELLQVRLAIISGNASPDPPQFKDIMGSNLFWLESPALIHAEYNINKGTRNDCLAGLEIIEKGLSQLRRHHNVRQEIQYLAAKAMALWHMSEKQKALEVLKKSLVRAKPQGLVRSFVNRGPLMAELLNHLSNTHASSQYLETLRKAFRDMTSSAESATDTVELSSQTTHSSGAFIAAGLTNREIDILKLLHLRLTNKEIAQRLNISPITVKSHSIKIYRKLKVHSRRQAVDRAEQLGVLKD